MYSSIPHNAGLEAKKVASADLVHVAEFVLKDNFLEFDSKVKQQMPGTAIGIKFAPPYAYILMEKVEIDFLETQTVKPLVWLKYIDNIFLISNEGE